MVLPCGLRYCLSWQCARDPVAAAHTRPYSATPLRPPSLPSPCLPPSFPQRQHCVLRAPPELQVRKEAPTSSFTLPDPLFPSLPASLPASLPLSSLLCVRGTLHGHFRRTGRERPKKRGPPRYLTHSDSCEWKGVSFATEPPRYTWFSRKTDTLTRVLTCAQKA